MERDSFAEGVVDGGEGGDDSGFGAQNQFAERGFAETGGVRGGKLGVGPAAFGADSEDGLLAGWLGLEDLTKGRSVRLFGEQDLYGTGGACGEGFRGLRHALQHGTPGAARLLRGFGENFLPTLGALPCRGEQAFFAARGGERHDGAHAEFGGFFDGPLEGVEFHDGEKQRQIDSRRMRGNFLEQREFNAFASDLFDPPQPHALAIAQFVKLALLCAQDAAEVVRSVAFNHRGVTCELFNEKASPHVQILSQSHTPAGKSRRLRRLRPALQG